MSVRRAYFRAITQLDSDQQTSITDLANQVANLYVAKADAAEFSTRMGNAESQIAGHDAQLSARPTVSEVTDLLAGKADQIAVDALSTSVTAVQAAVGAKADQAAVDARVSQENAFFSAFSEAIFLESAPASGTEFDYSGLGIAPSGGAGGS